MIVKPTNIRNSLVCEVMDQLFYGATLTINPLVARTSNQVEGIKQSLELSFRTVLKILISLDEIKMAASNIRRMIMFLN